MADNIGNNVTNRRAWLTAAIVALALGAAGLYANGQNPQSVPAEASVASAPAGVELSGGGTETKSTDKTTKAVEAVPASDKTTKAKSKKDEAPSPEPVAEAALPAKAEESTDSTGGGGLDAPKEVPNVDDPAPQTATAPQGDKPAHSSAVRYPHRYGDRKPYEGAPSSQVPAPIDPVRYGGREAYQGVPPGQAPDVRGGNRDG